MAYEEPLFMDLFTDPRLIAYLPKRNNEAIGNLFRETLGDYALGRKLTRWALFDTQKNEFAGIAILKYIADDPKKAELGYVVTHENKGKGFATELAVGLLKYGFETIDLDEIFAVTDHENLASQRVLLKAGLLRGYHLVRGGEELSFFSITKAAYALAR